MRSTFLCGDDLERRSGAQELLITGTGCGGGGDGPRPHDDERAQDRDDRKANDAHALLQEQHQAGNDVPSLPSGSSRQFVECGIISARSAIDSAVCQLAHSYPHHRFACVFAQNRQLRASVRSLTRMIRLLRLVILCILLAHAGVAAAQDAPTSAPDRVRVFLDCSFFCDENYLRQEITVIDYMRDRKDADLHILVTTQSTGGGGTSYTIKFIGLARFAGIEQTLKYMAPQTATSDENRKGIAEVLKRGLVRYVLETPLAPRITVTFTPDAQAAKADPAKDPWNLWVFRANVGGSFNGEQSNKSRSLRGSASANRTTDDWRLSFSTSMNYSENSFQLETEVFKSVSRNFDTSALAVKSLTQPGRPAWSATLGPPRF